MATPNDVQRQNTSRGEEVERAMFGGVWGLLETFCNLDKDRMKEDRILFFFFKRKTERERAETRERQKKQT